MFKYQLLLLMVGFFAQTLAYSSDRIALVIGNNAYPDKPLYNAKLDATTLADTLRAMNFEVIEPVLDANFDTMLDAMEAFGKKAEKAEVALAYYAGHAIQVEGENYLLPAKAAYSNITMRTLRKAIRLSDLQEEAGLASGLGIVLVDACRDNPFASRLASRSPNRSVGTRGLDRAQKTRARKSLYVGFATRANDIAADGEVGENSPYAKALRQHLPTKDTDFRVVMGRVREAVMAVTGNRQEPTGFDFMGGTVWPLGGESDRSGGGSGGFDPDSYFAEASAWISGTDEGRWLAAITRFSVLAEQGHDQAMQLLGDAYYVGHGVAANETLGCHWYRRAEQAGNAKAKQRLQQLKRCQSQ